MRLCWKILLPIALAFVFLTLCLLICFDGFF
jgi:NADH:ubiquinone oxidoreductase subunit H